MDQRLLRILIALGVVTGTADFSPAGAHPPHSIAAASASETLLIDVPSRRLARVGSGDSPELVVDFTALGVSTEPHSIVADPAGGFLVAETYGRRLWHVDSEGRVESHPRSARPDDGRGAIQHIAFGPRGRLHLLRRHEADEVVVYTLERDEEDGSTTTLFQSDAPAHRRLYSASFVVDARERVTLTMHDRILRLEDGALRVVAGAAEEGHRDGRGADARFRALTGIALADDGVIFVCDFGNDAIRRVTRDGVVTTVAATGGVAGLRSPYQIAFAPDGAAIIAEECHDPWRHRVRRVKDGRFEILAEFEFHERPAGRPDRTASDLLRISDEAKRDHDLETLTGLHPVRDWPLSLWVERSESNAVTTRGLFLPGVRHLRLAEAQTLAAIPRGRLFLRDLEVLDPVVARALGSSHAELFLDGLPTIDQPTAQVLVEGRRERLSLRGLESLDVETARSLANFERSLRLGSGIVITAPLAAELARWDGWGEQVTLALDTPTLGLEAARELAKCTGWAVALDGLTSVSPEVARALGGLDTPQLSLGGLTTIDLELAREISRWDRKFIVLDGVTSLSAEARALLEAGCLSVSLRSLRPNGAVDEKSSPSSGEKASGG